MNWDKAWRSTVTVTAGAGVGNAILTASEPSAWMALLGGIALLIIICGGVYSDYKRPTGDVERNP